MSTSLLTLDPSELRPIDRQIAKTFGKPPWSTDLLMQNLLGTLSFRTSEAHTCIDLAQEEEGTKAALLPDDLHSHPLVAHAPKTNAPLVLDGERLYTQRLWKLENTLAKNLSRRITREKVDQAPQAAKNAPELLDAIFKTADPEQKKAILSMLGRSLYILQGGPGTGKTTCLATLIALELKQNPKLVLRLAAPSGKAAARMKEAITSSFQQMPKEHIPPAYNLETYTLHRLLNTRPQEEHFHFNAANPLYCDLLVVDEAGMIDLPMMVRLLDALPPHGRLLLLGDKDQLSSVETGSVFADLIEALPNNLARLQVNHRFKTESHLGQFAEIIQGEYLNALLPLLKSCLFMQEPASSESVEIDDSLTWFRHDQKEVWMDKLLDTCQALCKADSDSSWEALSSFRALTPVNKGPGGVHDLNKKIELRLQSRGLLATKDFPDHRPVRVRKNDHSLKIYNGDIGLITHDKDQVMVRFQETASSPGDRLFPITRFPDLETAWAITIHASQGDGYDDVFVNLPPSLSRATSRELLYTAITRAKKRVFLLAEEDQIRHAISTPASRQSGLSSQIKRELEHGKTQQST